MKVIKIIAVLGVLLLLSGCNGKMVTNDFYALDTFITIQAKVDGLELEVLEDKINEYEKALSGTLAYSTVNQFNRANGEVFQDEDLSTLLQISRLVGMLSLGAFDVTLAPVNALWDFKAQNPVVPDYDEIQKALEHVDFNAIQKMEPPMCQLSDPQAQVDFGGIAKGFITDKAVEYFIDINVNCALLNFGGNVFALGEKSRGVPWTVGIKNPLGDGVIARVHVVNRAVVTSGNYERYFDLDGIRFHHILDPKTGYPVQNGLASVTIIADNATLADALSTACYVMGTQQGIGMLNNLDNACGIFVLDDGSMLFSEGAEAYLAK